MELFFCCCFRPKKKKRERERHKKKRGKGEEDNNKEKEKVKWCKYHEGDWKGKENTWMSKHHFEKQHNFDSIFAKLPSLCFPFYVFFWGRKSLAFLFLKYMSSQFSISTSVLHDDFNFLPRSSWELSEIGGNSSNPFIKVI